jgi:hypothetical protein
MWNFIDDSGSFSWHNRGKSLFCGVTVSDAELAHLERRFLDWRRSIIGPSRGDLKGEELTDKQLYSFAYKVLPRNSGNWAQDKSSASSGLIGACDQSPPTRKKARPKPCREKSA